MHGLSSGILELMGPLSGIRVVEVGVWHAGPGAGAILGDMGADVIKVETFEGDPERHFGAFGPMASTSEAQIANWSGVYEFSNRNKRSICLDLTNPVGREAFERLIATADVFLTNLRGPTVTKLGLDPATISAINPRLIHHAVSGFGSTGPMADQGGFDSMGQGVAGLMYLGSDDPVVLQMLVLDQLTAITAAFAIITSLFVRERDGQGPASHTSLYAAGTWLAARNLQATALAGRDISTAWDRRAQSPLRTTFECKGGAIMGTNHPEHKFWPSLCEALGRADLVSDARFASTQDRLTNSHALYAELDPIFAIKSRSDWLEILSAHGLLFAPVNRPSDVLTDPQALANNYVTDFDHEDLGRLRLPGFPVQFEGFSAGPQTRAPRLGEHTVEVLQELGLNPDALQAAGAIPR